MQRHWRDLYHIGTHMAGNDEGCIRFEVAGEGAMVVKRQVRIVPAAAQLNFRPWVRAAHDVLHRPVVHVKAGGLAIEVPPRGPFKVSAQREVERPAGRDLNGKTASFYMYNRTVK